VKAKPRRLLVRLANTPDRYGSIAILLHWAMAGLIIALAGSGLYMVWLPDVGFDTWKITLILVHKAVGMVALAVVALRLLWRWANVLPSLAGGLPEWQQVTARFVHLAFYALMFALPLTGWLMSSAGGYPVPVFDWFNAPDLIGANEYLFRLYIVVHRWLGYALLLLLALHAGAALHHHLGLRDDTLRRMLPGA
jgi:cytochrome b561